LCPALTLLNKLILSPDSYISSRLKRCLSAKRYLFRGQAAQQGFQLFFYRVVGKIYLVHFSQNYNKNIALLYSISCFLNRYIFENINVPDQEDGDC
jgi:hypothetical protein